MENPNEVSFFDRYAATIKGITIFILSMFLLIPTVMVSGLIHERESRKEAAIREVSEKWGNQQTLIGPIMAIPYEKINRDEKGKEYGREQKTLFVLPENLRITGEVNTEKRYRGIFEVVLYSGKLNLSGAFQFAEGARLPSGEVNIQWQNARLMLGIPDLRGLEDQVGLAWDGVKSYFKPGSGDHHLIRSGIHAGISLPAPAAQSPENTFSIDISLKGSGSLSFAPVGKITEVNIKSPWPDPSFSGAFLPDEKNIQASGFQALWKVLNLNRNYPQAWTNDSEVNIHDSRFGVEFFTPVDNYQRSERSVKYAILFIGLTFLVVFFVEMRQSRKVHPFQYALIGLALIIFYTLLVSISEHLPFNNAYLIAALMTVVLTTLFARSLFASTQMGLLVGGTLSVLYLFLYVVLQQQDYALLIGSIGLFIILAIVMYFSRQIKL